MHKVVGLSGLAIVLTSGVALAADCTNGGTVSVTPGLLGKSYTAFVGIDIVGGEQATCTYGFDVTNGALPGTISVFSTQYRGYVEINNASEQATVSFTHNGKTETDTYTTNGPSGEDYTHDSVVATVDGRIRDSATVDMSGTTNAADDQGTVDTADYTEIGRITLPTDESSIVLHLGASAGLLTSGQPISDDSSFGFFGGVGSAMLGGHGQFQLGGGFSLLGGIGYVAQSYDSVAVSGAIGALAVRYVQPGLTGFRPFGEGGATIGGLGLTFNDPSKTTTTSALGSLYARGGVVADLDAQNSVTLAATLEETGLGVSGYSLSDGAFAATIASQSGRFTVAKAGAEWRGQLTDTVDASASAAVGVMIAHDTVAVDVDGIGLVKQAPPSQLFVDYGARLGWQFSQSSRLEGFLQGSTTQDLGTHVQVGAGYTQKF